jgi:DNA-binding protein H-NS
MTNFQELSEHELKSVISDAEKALQVKRDKKRKEVLEQIYELAASIDIKFEVKESDRRSMRKGMKVPYKYRNPYNPGEQWSGRGMTPLWLRSLIESGRDKAEFEV